MHLPWSGCGSAGAEESLSGAGAVGEGRGFSGRRPSPGHCRRPRISMSSSPDPGEREGRLVWRRLPLPCGCAAAAAVED